MHEPETTMTEPSGAIATTRSRRFGVLLVALIEFMMLVTFFDVVLSQRRRIRSQDAYISAMETGDCPYLQIELRTEKKAPE